MGRGAFLDQDLFPVDVHTQIRFIHQENARLLVGVAHHEQEEENLLLAHRKMLIAKLLSVSHKLERTLEWLVVTRQEMRS